MNRPFWSFRSASSDNCETIEPLLSLYADGMASPAEARRVDAHLPGCPDCRAALSWMRATRAALASRPVAVPPPDLHSRIAFAIAASSAAPALRPARVFSLRTAYAAAASVTVLGIALAGHSVWHSPGQVAVHPARKPAVVAAVPHPAVKPRLAPETPVRPLVASNVVKPLAAKHTIMARKTVPIAVTAPEHVAVRLPATGPSVVPQTVKAPVHHAPPTQKIASGEAALTQKQSIEKHLPLPVRTVAPKPLDTQKVAKIIKEPTRVDIQPTKVTPDLPPVQTASMNTAVSDNPLGPVLAYVKRASHASLATVKVPAQRSYHEATNVIQDVGNSDQTAFISAVHGNQ